MADALESTRGRPTVTDRLDHAIEDWAGEQHPVAEYLARTEARTVPRLALFGAVSTWFALIYGLTYVALPTLTWSVGLHQNLVANWIGNTLSFVPTAIGTAALIAVVSPKVVTHLDARRDPVIAATLGSLLVWLVSHEFLADLQPLTGMYWAEALSFALTNGLEFGLLGLVLASVTRSPTRAFALSVAFQLVNLAIFTSVTGG